MKKIFASDYDGTLCIDGSVSEDARAAIRQWRAHGNLFGICTGRNKRMAVQVIEEQGLEVDFLICCTGALILGSDLSVLLQSPARGVDMPKFASVAAEFHSQRFWVTDDEDLYDIDMGGGMPGQIAALDSGFIRSFHQCNTAFSDKDDASRFIARIYEDFGGLLWPHVNCSCIDITAFGVGKASGISQYARLVGCTDADVITAGDNLNDVDMLSRFEGYAVAGSLKEAVDAAGKTADGIADIIAMNI